MASNLTEANCFGMSVTRDIIYYWTPIVEHLWVYKARIGDRIIGGIVTMPTRHRSWYVNSLFVDTKFRRLGIASKLLQKAIRLAKGKSVILDVKTSKR
jgi:GNAT superfamily N-acetyltransferase